MLEFTTIWFVMAKIVVLFFCDDHSGIHQHTNSDRRTVNSVSKLALPVLIKERLPRSWTSSKRSKTRYAYQ